MPGQAGQADLSFSGTRASGWRMASAVMGSRSQPTDFREVRLMPSGTPAAALAGITALASAGAVACSAQEGTGQGTGGSASAARTVHAAYTATTNAKTASYTLKGTVRAASAGG